jgi:5-methyltetrahydrofolate--homocysteine methyltransferase
MQEATERSVALRGALAEPGVASLYSHVPFRQDTAFLAIRGARATSWGSGT